MPISTWEHQGEGQDLFKRQKCHDGVPISTRYEVSTITTYYVSYSYYSPPHSTELPPKTSRPPPTSRIHFTLKTPRPQISIPETSTTRLPPKKSVVSTASDTILKARAPNSVPVTITHTIVTRVPVETIYSCPPPSSREPLTTRHAGPTSPRTSRAPPSSREPPTSFSREPSSWVEPTSRSNRELPTSWRSNTTEPTASPSTSRSSISSGGPWYPTSSTPSTPSSGHRPTGPPSTSLSPSTRTTSTIPVPTSAPNSTVTWPPISTQSYSECVYTLFDGTVPYGNYTASCTGSTSSESLCTSVYSNGQWDIVPCTSTYTNTSGTTSTSTLTNTTTSTQTITSWPCSSYVPGWETWVGVPCTSSTNVTSSTWSCSSYATSLERWVPAPCTSTTPIITTSSIEYCSIFLGLRPGWVLVPCTSTPSLTSTPPTIITTPTVTTTPTLTQSISCSTYVEELTTWLPMPCNTTTTTPTITTIPSILITRSITETPTLTETPTITEASNITETSTASQSRHCSVYIWELDVWISVPCTTASPTPSMCLDDDQDMWVPCTSVIRTSNTGTLSPSITEPSNTTPIVTRTITPTRTTRTRPPETFFPSVTSVETDEPTSVNEPTQTPETATHIPTRTRTTRPSSAASLETSNGFTPTSQVSLGSSVEVKPSSSREARPSSTQEEEPSSTREAVTVRGSSHSQSTRPVSTSTRLPQPPSSSGIMTSNFIVPTSGGVSLPSPSSTITTAPGGIQGGALAGIIVGSILGVVGLLGLGAFLMKSFGTPRGRDLFAPRGAYQVAPGGGSVSGRDSGGGGGGGAGGRSSGMSEARNDAPLRPALRNRNIADANGGWDRTYAYTGVAAAAAVAATTANNQRGRDSGTGGRYSDGGIRTEDTPDAIPRRYADGGISGPDSHFDPRITSHPYGDQDPRYLVSSSEVQFDPYHDLPVRQDSTPVGGNITRQSALTSPEISISPPGPTPAYPAVPEDVPGGYSGSTIQPAQTAPGVSLSGTDHLSITSFAPSIIDQTVEPQAPGNLYQGSPPYAEISGTGTIPYSSEPFAFTDIQRPPYWEDSIRAASVDSLPQHGNIPRYSALTDFGSVPGIGSSPAPGYNNTPGIGSAPTSVPGVGSVTGAGGPQPPGVVNPTWNSVGVTEFGQNVIDPSSAPGDATTCISVPEAPRGLHQGLTRLSTEVGSAQRGNTDPSSPRSASRAGIRPPRVGGPRPRPSRPSIPRPDSRYSLPPAYEERQNNT